MATPAIEERIVQARKLHQAGSLGEAIDGYGAVLAQAADRADVWHLKAMAEHQAGRLAPARESIGRALAVGGEQPAYVRVEAAILHDSGELAAAEKRLERVLELKPGWGPAHLELGRVRMDQGRVDRALGDFQAAASADASNPRAWNNVGIALQALGRLDEALRAFNHTLTLDARYPLAHFNLARIHKARGEADRALEHVRHAVREDPSLTDAWLLLGDIHDAKRETESAFAAYASAVQSAPNHVPARTALASQMSKVGAYLDARGEYQRLAAQFPASLRAALPANLLLPQVYASEEQLEGIRSGYAQGLQRLREAAPRFRFANAEQALNEARWTNFYLAYQGRDDAGLQREYGEFLRGVLAPAMPELFQPRAREPGRARIRVGFCSHFFFNCTAGRYFSSWITHLDRSRFEIFVYYTNEWVADDTRTIAAAADTFRHRPGRSVHALAREIAEDRLDVLVYPELGMHMETFTLAALRLAPVQCSGWGHPTTPGHPEIDRYISCAAMEPPNAPSQYNEKLELLPGLGTRYAIPAAEPEGTRADFGLPEDRTIYLVPQSLFKIHPDNDALIAEVLARDPKGLAVMFASPYPRITDVFASRLARALEARGLALRDRVGFLEPSLTHGAYLRLNAVCDVMIDTVHWSGGNTSLDALAMGLPVVTRPGDLMRGRQSQAMLGILGVPELVTADLEGHAATAVRVGQDKSLRASLSERILAARSTLFEREEPVRALEELLERAARGS